MSAAAISKIIENANKQQESGISEKDLARERAESRKEIVKELVPPEEPPKKRGRPPKTTQNEQQPAAAPKSPKSPRLPPNLKLPKEPQPFFQPQDAQHSPHAIAIANKIKNQPLVAQLDLMRRKFPGLTGELNQYNPWLHSPEENLMMIESIRFAVKREVEFLTAPAVITDGLQWVEDMALAWSAENYDHPVAPFMTDLAGTTNALLNDKAVSLDVALVECEISDFMPKSPWARLAINAARVISKVWSRNYGMRRMKPVGPVDRYSDL